MARQPGGLDGDEAPVKRTTTSVIAAAVASVALLFSGCSGDDGSAAAGDPSTPDAELTYTSPLAKALNLGNASKLGTEQQKQTAQCMADRGWDYTPVKIPGGVEDELGAVDEYADLFDEEYRTRWGYGISTIYADDGGYAEGSPAGVFSGGEDPNQAYVDSLSPEEQQRYNTDLFGADLAGEVAQPAAEGAEPTIPGDAAPAASAGDPAGSEDPNSGSESDLDADTTADPDAQGANDPGLQQMAGSCALAGMSADSSKDLARLEQLTTKLDQASTDLGINSTVDLVESSPELAKAQKAWAECMAKADHRVTTVDDPEAQLSERLDGVLFGSTESPEPDLGGVTSVPADPGGDQSGAGASQPPTEAEGDPGAGGDSEVVAGGDDQPGATGAAAHEQAFDPADVDLAKLKQLQADELAMAADDRDCQAEYFRPVYLDVRSAAEQRFVDRNGALLSELAKLSGLG